MEEAKANNNSWAYLIIAIVVLAGDILLSNSTDKIPVEYTLIPKILAAILILILLIKVLISEFHARSLTDKTEALALPGGSIRALLAFSLMVMFVAVGIFSIVASEPAERVYTHHELSKEEIITLYGDNITSLEEVEEEKAVSDSVTVTSQYYRVHVLRAKNDHTYQFIQYFLSTLGTLVVAISGFYFGTRAVQVAKGDKVKDAPLIRDVIVTTESGKETCFSPATPFKLQITGKFFDDPSVFLIKADATIAATALKYNRTSIDADFNPGEESPEGEWAVVVRNEDGAEDKLEKALLCKKIKKDEPTKNEEKNNK